MEINDLFNRLDQLPTLPKIVQELIQTLTAEDADIMGIAHQISLEQVISAKVLRLVNSAHYARGSNVTSIEDAVIRLGFNTVRTLVLASGVSSSFQQPEHFDQYAFWSRTFTIAIIAKGLAKQTEYLPETAFTCGVLHNIGEIIIRISMPEQCVEIDNCVAKGASLNLTQQEVLGFNYADVGAALAHRWRFSSLFVNAIRDQLTPLEYADFNPYAGFIHMATYLYEHWLQPAEEAEIEQRFPKALAIRLGIALPEILEDKEKMLSESKALTEMLE